MAKVTRCPFCDIANGVTDKRTPAILYQDNQVVAFQDRNPSAFRHYLIIPIAHVKNVKALVASNNDNILVKEMHKVGRSLLERDAPNSQHRFGFHRPPWRSVDHLHLHCLALPYISWWRSVRYTSLGCLGAWVSVEKVLQRLSIQGTTPTDFDV